MSDSKEWSILFTDEEGIIPPESATIQFDVEFNEDENTTTIRVINVPRHIVDRWFDHQEQIEDELRTDYGNSQIKF